MVTTPPFGRRVTKNASSRQGLTYVRSKDLKRENLPSHHFPFTHYYVPVRIFRFWARSTIYVCVVWLFHVHIYHTHIYVMAQWKHGNRNVRCSHRRYIKLTLHTWWPQPYSVTRWSKWDPIPPLNVLDRVTYCYLQRVPWGNVPFFLCWLQWKGSVPPWRTPRKNETT